MTDDALDRLAPLADPVRRSLYAFVVAQPEPVDRDAAAAGVGIGRPLAAFHLDRLAAAGLLGGRVPPPERPDRAGRRTPGEVLPAGARSRDVRIAAAAPLRRPRRDPRGGRRAVRRGARSEALDAASRRGHELAVRRRRAARSSRRSSATLAERGYEPAVDADGVVRLRNCPFDRLATDHRELTCSLNLAMLTAVAEDFDAAGLRPGRRRSTGSAASRWPPGPDPFRWAARTVRREVTGARRCHALMICPAADRRVRSIVRPHSRCPGGGPVLH